MSFILSLAKGICKIILHLLLIIHNVTIDGILLTLNIHAKAINLVIYMILTI